MSVPASPAIPLGSTEINPGGLSPMPLATCLATSGGTFDGGGLMGCATSAGQLSPNGVTGSSMGSLPTATPDPSLSGGNLPLGAIETGNAGLSPLLPAPSTMPGLSAPGAMPSLTTPGTTPTLALPSPAPCAIDKVGTVTTSTSIQTAPGTC
jgi:hypothetical protein